MTSRWIRSAPALTARRTSRARFARSLLRTLAAMMARPSPISARPTVRGAGARVVPGGGRRTRDGGPRRDPPAARAACRAAEARGSGLRAALTAEGDRRRGLEELAPPGHGRRRRLARLLGSQLATGRSDLLAAIAPDGHAQPSCPEPLGKGRDPRRRAGPPGGVRHRVHRDAVDVGAGAAQEPHHRLGVGSGVVDAVDQHVLVADAPAGRLPVGARGGHHVRDGPAAVERDEEVAQRIAGGVEADRQGPLGPQPGEPLDPRDHARRRDRDVARSQPEARRIRESCRGVQDRVEVEERLAHPHEDDVREVAPGAGQAAPGMARLVDDLGHVKIAVEAELPGGTERAADGTPRLAADAEGVPLPPVGAARVVHQDGLDEPPVGEAVEGLLASWRRRRRGSSWPRRCRSGGARRGPSGAVGRAS